MKMRNVHLEGELANRFGEMITVAANTLQDIFRILHANDPTIRKYLIDCHEKGIDFSCETADKTYLGDEDCILPLESEDIYLAPIPAGSKSAAGKILTAIAIVFVLWYMPWFGTKSGSLVGITGSTGGMVALNVAVGLAMAGVQQMMMPDPSIDDERDSSYLFNGNQRSITEGDPIPLLYGELRVPGRPIGFELLNQNTYFGGEGYANSGHPSGEVVQQLR